MFADREKIEALWGMALVVGLEGLDFLVGFDAQELTEIYNGAGPDFFPEEVRRKVTKYLALFEPAVMIHDARFDRCEGGTAGFDYANREFLENCRRLADDRYPWYNWRRYRARAAAYVLYLFVCGPGGQAAWALAYYKKKESK